MAATSHCISGSVGAMIVERSFLSALTATGDTPIVATDAGRKGDASNGAKQTAATNKVPKAGLTIAIVSDSIAGDTTQLPNLLSKIP